jgi:hypothetical protein
MGHVRGTRDARRDHHLCVVPPPVAVRQEENLACEPHQLSNAYSRDIQYLTLTVPGSLKAVS